MSKKKTARVEPTQMVRAIDAKPYRWAVPYQPDCQKEPRLKAIVFRCWDNQLEQILFCIDEDVWFFAKPNEELELVSIASLFTRAFLDNAEKTDKEEMNKGSA